MGLKGKIEAIIYAADEPITLDQIAFLIKEPILQELAAERERAAASEVEKPVEVVGDSSAVEGDTEQAESVATLQPAGENSIEPDGIRPDDEPGVEESFTPDSASASAAVPKDVPVADELPPAIGAKSEDAQAKETAPQPVVSKRKSKNEVPPEVRSKVRALVEELMADYTGDRGMEIRQVAGGYRMATKPEHHDLVKVFAKSLKPPLRLSLPALETLAVVAYKQPVTAPEVSEIRGVDSQGVIATLLDRKLVTTAGRKAVIGRPILYKTTKDFLLRFGLKDISELPSMEEFEKLAQEAGQVDMFEKPDEVQPDASPSSTESAAATESSPVDAPEPSENAADSEAERERETAGSQTRSEASEETQEHPAAESVADPTESEPVQ